MSNSDIVITAVRSAYAAVKAFKASQSVALLLDTEPDLSALQEARDSLAYLRALPSGDRGGLTFTDPDTGKSQTFNGNGEYWHDVVIATCGVKGGAAHVRKGKMSAIKEAGKALRG